MTYGTRSPEKASAGLSSRRELTVGVRREGCRSAHMRKTKSVECIKIEIFCDCLPSGLPLPITHDCDFLMRRQRTATPNLRFFDS